MSKVRMVFGGQWRGTPETWECVKKFKEYHNADVYVASHQSWKFPFEFNFVQTPERLNGTIFEQVYHAHNEKYILQWSGLYNSWNNWNFNWDASDIVVRVRNDLVFPIFELNPEENTFHVPTKEFHAEPFPTDIFCNDQISYGYKDVMDTYFKLPYTFNWKYPRKQKAIEYHNGICGIEEILRTHLYDNNIELKTFDLIYDRGK